MRSDALFSLLRFFPQLSLYFYRRNSFFAYLLLSWNSCSDVLVTGNPNFITLERTSRNYCRRERSCHSIRNIDCEWTSNHWFTIKWIISRVSTRLDVDNLHILFGQFLYIHKNWKYGNGTKNPHTYFCSINLR